MRSGGLTTGRGAAGERNSRRWERLTIAAGALMISFTWLLFSTPALAHTDLAATRPGDGELLTDPVARIELEFTGGIAAEAISIRLLDGDGGAIAVTTTLVSEELVVVEPQLDLEGGRYAVLWSARSASDGHEVSGSFGFEVVIPGSGADAAPVPEVESAAEDEVAAENPPAVDDAASETSGDIVAPAAAPVAERPAATPTDTVPLAAAGEDGGDAVAAFLGWLGRWVSMAGAIIGVGAIAFAGTSLVGTAGEVRRAASWIRFGGMLVLAGSVIELTAAATSAGHGLLAALMPWTWIDVLPAAQAYAMVLRIAGAIAMLQSPRLVRTSPGTPVSDPLRDDETQAADRMEGSTVATATRAEPLGNRLEIQHEWVALAGATMVIGSFALDGHTADAGLIGRLASMAHVLAAGVWAGGLVVMADLLLRRRRTSRRTEAASVAIRFSRVASAALVLTAIAGGALAWSLVDEPSELWSGAWGRSLAVKLAFVAAAAAIGGYNHFRVVPRLDQPGTHASDTLRRTVAIESLLIMAVLAATAVLVTAAP
ncbi:MAG: CopD family protein [Acidimicrobiia bacterium]|nr:CopD family protein [Acidimicrobiia bacterium]